MSAVRTGDGRCPLSLAVDPPPAGAAVLLAGQDFQCITTGDSTRQRILMGCQERSISVISGGMPKRTGRIEQPIPPVTIMWRFDSQTWP